MLLEVKVTAGAKRQEIKLEAGILKVKVISRAQRGKANQELIEYLAEVLGLKKGDVTIVRGERDTRKVISLPMDKTRLDSLFETRFT